MKESDAIQFYRGILKCAPSILEGTDHNSIRTCLNVFKETFKIEGTREHVRIAISEHRGNSIKRAWDLKQRYIIAMILSNPNITEKEIAKSIKGLFNQKTRPSVIASCFEEAKRMKETRDYYEIMKWVHQIHSEYRSKSKDPSILLW